MLKETKLIQMALPYFEDYRRGNREIYTKLFKPDVIPNFTFTRLVSDLPENLEIIDQYEISNNEYDKSFVTILKRKDESKLMYHLNPTENSLKGEQGMLLNLARGVLIEHNQKQKSLLILRERGKFFLIFLKIYCRTWLRLRD